jgi:hypothetical protein
MTQPLRLGWAACVMACCVSTACFPSDEAREEFCRNADSARQRKICLTGSDDDAGADPAGGTDGGTTPEGGTDGGAIPEGDIDGGTDEAPLPDACGLDGTGSPIDCSSPPECMEWNQTCSNGQCVWTPKSAGSPCGNSDGCSPGDHCDGSGTCVRSTPTDCSHPSECQEWAGTCSSGTCNWRPKLSGTPCSDHDACTTDDYCDGAGACVPGEPVICPSHWEDCEELVGGACNPAAGCIYQSRCGPDAYCNGAGFCCSRQQGMSVALPPICRQEPAPNPERPATPGQGH